MMSLVALLISIMGQRIRSVIDVEERQSESSSLIQANAALHRNGRYAD